MRKIEDAEALFLAEGHRELFVSGYQSLDVKKVAEACGTGIGTFYGHFGSKKEFALAVIRYDCEERTRELEAILGTGLPMEGEIRAIVSSLRDCRRQIDTVYWQIPIEPAERRRIVEGERALIQGFAAGVVRRAAEAGTLHANEDMICSFLTQYLVAEASTGGMPLDDFLACLDILMGHGVGGEQATAAEKDAEARYECALENIEAAVPGSAGVAHVDVTENTFRWMRGPREGFAAVIEGRVWDELVELIARGVSGDAKRDEVRSFRCAKLARAFETGEKHVSCDYRRTDETGKPRWLSSHAHLLRNPGNGHVECIAYTQDVTADRQRSAIFDIITSRSFDLVALLHLRERTFEAVFLGETLPRAFRRFLPERGSVCDFDAFCAESALHMEGETRGDYARRLSSDYFRAELEQGGGSYEFTVPMRFDDETMYRRLLHYRLEGDPDTVLVIESDVTVEIEQQRERTAVLLARAERDRAIMDSIMGAICILLMDKEGHLSVDYFNSYVFEMLGYDSSSSPQTAEDAQGTPAEPLFADALSFIHPDDRAYVARTYREHRDDGSFSLEPYRMFNADGEPLWIKVKVRRGAERGGKRLFYVAMHDVTQETKLAAELEAEMEDERRLRREADAANAAKTEFLSRMSHDIRTPLNGVIGMANLARRQENPPRTNECLAKVDTSAKFLLGIINDALDMAKVEGGKIELHPEPYLIGEFNEYLDAVIRPLCDEKGVHLVVEEDVPGDVCPLVDKNAIGQVLFNLLSNAVKFTSEGGTVSYRIEGRQVGQGRMAVRHRVLDTGIGMSEGFQERMFEPFSQEWRDDTSDKRGSGLGLAIAKGMVDLMGGTIAVESKLGQGTAISVDLEFDTVPVGAVSRSPELGERAVPGGIRGARVLLCEDHPLNQEIVRTLLEEDGALVDVEGDGRSGVEAFEESSVGFYDAILMDVRMPVMNGKEAARRIRELDRGDARSVPIIAVTADAFADDVEKCLAVGMDAHIAKPIDPRLLEQTLGEAIMRRRGLR